MVAAAVEPISALSTDPKIDRLESLCALAPEVMSLCLPCLGEFIAPTLHLGLHSVMERVLRHATWAGPPSGPAYLPPPAL